MIPFHVKIGPFAISPVELFAFLHDAYRSSERGDSLHGPRADQLVSNPI